MNIGFVILSLACLLCLVPTALGTGLVAKAAALGAAKGGIIGGIKGAAIGAGVGLAAKGAAALVTKKALVGIALKAAALKGAAILAAKKAAFKGIGALAIKGIAAAKGIFTVLSTKKSQGCMPPISKSSIMELLSGAVQKAQSFKARVVVPEESAIVYRYITEPRIIAVPVETI